MSLGEAFEKLTHRVAGRGQFQLVKKGTAILLQFGQADVAVPLSFTHCVADSKVWQLECFARIICEMTGNEEARVSI